MFSRNVLVVWGALGLMAIALTATPASAAAKGAIDGVVNINTATPEELQLLPGIGPAKVERILAYRWARPFRTVEELVRVKGIGRKMVRRLRAHLAVQGPTTARPVSAGGGSARAAPQR